MADESQQKNGAPRVEEVLRHYAGRTPDVIRYAYAPKDTLRGAAIKIEHLTSLLRIAQGMSPEFDAYIKQHYASGQHLR